MTEKSNQKYPLLSFFSGAGFLDIGFLRQKEFEIVWHNECHGPFADAYEYGVGALGYNSTNNRIQSRARMENLKHADIVHQAFRGEKPQTFGIIGGPPCPDFSRAGKNLGNKGSNGKLTGKYINMIIHLRPSFFLLENVPGLLETKKHRVFLFAMLKKLSKHYAIDVRILNALEYGVPQSRRRVFVVGVAKSWLRRHREKPNVSAILRKSKKIADLDISENRKNKEVAQDLSNLHWFCWPVPKYPDALSKYKWRSKKCPQCLTVGKHFSRINGHPNAGDMFRPYSEKFAIIKKGDVSRKSFKRLHDLSYSPNAAYGHNEVHLHPIQNRRISVAEALAIQSVPSRYAFPDKMTLSDKFKAVGNGVPVLLAEQVAGAILLFIKQGESHGNL